MRAVTIILLGCCLLAFAALVFVGNRLSMETAREIARLEAEINTLKRQMAEISTTGVPTVVAAASPVSVVSPDSGLVRARETGRLYEGTFRIRSCPEGTLNVESDRTEGIAVWCMKRK